MAMEELRRIGPTQAKPRVKAELENAVRNAVLKFEEDFMGRHPADAKAYILRDMVVVRLKGVMTPAERQLAKTAEGAEMLRRVRHDLLAQGREGLNAQVAYITGNKVQGLFTDLDTIQGERIFVFTVEDDLEATCQ